MDPKNDFELDISMESKSHYKLRSSLKKRKSRNPLAILDITEVNAEVTLAPPQRRVSFASSNYVKPFIDDPEKNTIWDNTYEEEVNQTDSTKSENTNQPHLSELGSHYQEITNVDVHKECITNIYCDPSVVDMDVSYFDQTLINDKLRNLSSESDLDITPSSAAIVDVKNITEFSKETTFNMELTCQWKNNIMQSSSMSKSDFTTNRNHLLGNATVSQEEDMSMTCCFNNDGGGELGNEIETVSLFSNNLLGTANQFNEIVSNFTRTAHVKNKEHIESVNVKKDKVFFPDQSEMEFTCVFPNKILETSQRKETRNKSPAMTAVSTDVENKENTATVFVKKDKAFLPDQSEMEFTCAFPNNILETNQLKETRNKFLAMADVSTDVENKENTAYVKKGKAFLPDQSEMEFTCAFPNNILETNQLKETRHKSSAMTAVSTDLEDKENTAYVKKGNAFFSDQSKMEFTCAFPNNILETNQLKETRNKFLAMTAVSTDVENKENTAYVKKGKAFLPEQSEMEFTCAFPNNILETSQLKVTRNKSPAMTAVSTNVENKENTSTVNVNQDKVFFSDQSEMEFTCAFPKNILEMNQLKETRNKSPAMAAVSTDVENKDNTATVNAKKDKVFFPDQREMEFTCAVPKNILKTNQHKETGNESRRMAALSTDAENKENKVADYAKNDKVFFPDQGETQFHISNNILGTSQLEGAKDVIVNVQNKENIPMVYTEKERNKEDISVAFPRSCLPTFCDETENGAIFPNCKFKQTEDVNFIKPKVNTEVSRPVKVMEFGNIPVAVDVSDLSMDQNVNYKLVSDTSRRPYDSKENTYTVSAASPKATKLQIIKDPINQSNKIDTQDNRMYSNECGESVIQQDKCILSESGHPSNKYALEESISNQQITKTTPDERQNEVGPSLTEKKVEYICAEECTLIESMEGSILINSITVPNEDQQKSLDVYLSENRAQNETSLIMNEDRNPTPKELQLCEIKPATKVIYSEAMNVKPCYNEFPSMQTSGLNPFSFTSIGSTSVEDTQQLIQTTFSKPSFAKSDQWEAPECSMLENSGTNPLNKSDSVIGLHDETRQCQSVLKDIKKKLFVCQFPPFNYKEVADSIKANRELNENMEKLLRNFKFPEIGTFTLQEKTKKLSLCNTSGDNSESMLDVVESVDDNNGNKSMVLEPIRSLHEKIVDVCTRSNKVLKIKYFKGNSYVFSTMYNCVLIYVNVHPEDDRVIEIMPASSLDDSMDSLSQFLVKTVLDKLNHSTLKSYLGPYYDVLSLLDHICLMVDEVMDFHYEFLSLQRLYASLKFNSDFSVSFEILHSSPPIWWRIRLHMTSVNKIKNPENLHCESEWSNIREEHIKEILRNIDEGVGSLRTFICEVSKYFDRTQLRFKV